MKILGNNIKSHVIQTHGGMCGSVSWMCFEMNTPAPSEKKRGRASNVLPAGAAINDISNFIEPPEQVQCRLTFRVVGFAPNELNRITF